MIASGITTRYLANQDDLAYSFSANFSNVTGRTEVGFTGLSGLNSHFTFESGRVFDFDNRYVWSYQQLNTINISGNIVNGLYNYFINGNPVCFLGNRASGYYTGFYVAPERVTVDLNLNVYSDATNYLIESPASILTGANITGYIVNTETIQERAFLVFSGDLFNSNVLFSLDSLATGYKISGGQSGEFIISQNYPSGGDTWASKLGSYTIPISLWTDFCNQITGININVVASPIYNIEFFTMFTGASGSNLFAGYAYVYQALTQSTGALPYCVEVAPISGFSGDLIGYFDLSGEYSGNVTGFIQGTDYVYGNVTNIGLSPSGDYYGNIVSGEVNTFISQLIEPTGLIVFNYGLALSGRATGLAPFGTTIRATGYASGFASGYITRSGRLEGLVDAPLMSGRYLGSLNTGSGQVLVTGFQWATGNFFMDFGRYPFTGFYTGDGYSGSSTQIYKINTGENVVINNGSGTFTFAGTKSYSNVSGELRQIITPLMTSNGTPAGETTASNEDFGEVYNAFDRSQFSSWAPFDTIGWAQYDFLGSVTGFCNAYNIITSTSYPLYPSTWAVSGSNDGINWTYLDSQTGITFTGNYQSKYVEFENTDPYDILRFSVFESKSGSTSDEFSTLEVAEIQFMQRTTIYSSGASSWMRNFAGTIFTGSGNYTGFFSGNFSGNLSGDISGYVPSIFFQTGVLSGIINPGSGSFRWTNILLTGNPPGPTVFNLPPYQTQQATGEIWFLNSTGSGLTPGDTINIQTNQFYYATTSNPPFGFNSPQNLVNIINSGAIGTYGFSIMQSLLVTGGLYDNIIRLSPTGLLGESGNQIKLSRVADDPAAIYIPYRYFQSGLNFYNESTTWSGSPFTGRYTLTIENSGIYSTSGISGFYYDINATTGVIWENSFSGNFQAYTGYINTGLTAIPYNTGTNSFSGCSYIPAATGQDSSGINIVLQVRNPYEISGNLAFFRVIIDEDIYSGYLPG